MQCIPQWDASYAPLDEQECPASQGLAICKVFTMKALKAMKVMKVAAKNLKASLVVFAGQAHLIILFDLRV